MSKLSYRLRLLHAFAGAVPFTAFMLLDLWANAKAAEGPAAFEHAMGWPRRVPLSALIALALPILFHAIFGLWLAVRALSQFPTSTSPSPRHVLQRVTGLLALVYVGLRLKTFWLPLWTPGSVASDVRTEWVAWASTTWNGMPLAAYAWLLALAAIAFHLGHGVVLAALRFGLAPTRRHRLVVTAVGALVGTLAFAFGAHGAIALATGWSPLALGSEPSGGACAPQNGTAP